MPETYNYKGTIYFAEDVGCTSTDSCYGSKINRTDGWVRFIVGEGESWERHLAVPSERVDYVEYDLDTLP